MNKNTTTIELTDYQIDRLFEGFSVNVDGTLITFAEGSQRRCKIGDEQ